MNKFQEKEHIGRWWFEQILKAGKVTDYEFSDDEYSNWDAKYRTSTTEYIVEIKVRDCNYNTYSDWILELSKYNKLQELAQQKADTKAVYVNIFNDGYFAIWDLDEVDIDKVRAKSCKINTVNNNGYTKKKIIPLLIKDAKFFGQIVNEQVTLLNYD